MRVLETFSEGLSQSRNFTIQQVSRTELSEIGEQVFLTGIVQEDGRGAGSYVCILSIAGTTQLAVCLDGSLTGTRKKTKNRLALVKFRELK